MTVADLEVKLLELDPKERARLAKRLLENLEALSEKRSKLSGWTRRSAVIRRSTQIPRRRRTRSALFG